MQRDAMPAIVLPTNREIVRLVEFEMSESPETRLVALELLVTHLERDLGALNSAVLGQQKEIETLRQVISRLEERVARLGEEEEPRSAENERPPHY